MRRRLHATKPVAWVAIAVTVALVFILGPVTIAQFLRGGLRALLIREFGLTTSAADLLQGFSWIVAAFLVLVPILVVLPEPKPRPLCAQCPHCGQSEHQEQVFRCDHCGTLFCERCSLTQSSTLGWYVACPRCEHTGSSWVATVAGSAGRK